MTSTAELSSPASAHGGLTHGIQDRDYTLDDKYGRTEGRIYLSGVQALVRQHAGRLSSKRRMARGRCRGTLIRTVPDIAYLPDWLARCGRCLLQVFWILVIRG